MLNDAYAPAIHLTVRCGRLGVKTDEAIVDALADELLAVPLTRESRATLVEFLRAQRTALEIADGGLLDAREHSESLLRRLAHLILSLPEAQLS
jgi:hypothetical protein